MSTGRSKRPISRNRAHQDSTEVLKLFEAIQHSSDLSVQPTRTVAAAGASPPPSRRPAKSEKKKKSFCSPRDAANALVEHVVHALAHAFLLEEEDWSVV